MSPDDDYRPRFRSNFTYLLEQAKSASKSHPPRYAYAEGLYRRIIEINPGEVRAYEGLGSIYLAQKKYDEAIASYEQAAEQAPLRPEAHYGLGVAYYEAGHKEEAAVQSGVLRALKRDKSRKLADKLDALIAK
jgi:tetratricopeptide (TPR) repeat protein